jgi:hypothetical protein
MPPYTKGNRLYKNKLRYSILPINKNIISNHINSATASRLLNKNASTDRLVYSSQNPYGGVGDAGIWVRNPSCWINGVNNISCFSPAQRSGANWFQRGGTLITRKHVLFAKHFKTSILPNGGTPLIFVDENNNAIRRNIIQYGDDISGSDISIALLDSEVPSNIKIAKVLPPNFTDYINCTISTITTPLTEQGDINLDPLLYAVALDQQEKAVFKICYSFAKKFSTGFVSSTSIMALANLFDSNQIASYGSTTPDPNQFASFCEAVVVGDSGNPMFLIIDNELIVLSAWFTPHSGTFITNRYNEVNSLIETLSPGEEYSLTPIDLELVYHKYS